MINKLINCSSIYILPFLERRIYVRFVADSVFSIFSLCQLGQTRASTSFASFL